MTLTLTIKDQGNIMFHMSVCIGKCNEALTVPFTKFRLIRYIPKCMLYSYFKILCQTHRQTPRQTHLNTL